jgi:hypothetical protein
MYAIVGVYKPPLGAVVKSYGVKRKERRRGFPVPVRLQSPFSYRLSAEPGEQRHLYLRQDQGPRITVPEGSLCRKMPPARRNSSTARWAKW